MSSGPSGIYSELIQQKRELDFALDARIRIALVGKGGCGKSSLINALVGHDICAVGARTDVTVDAQVVEFNGIAFVDLPGYATTQFPENSFTKEFAVDDYDLFLCVTDGKFLASDESFFRRYLNGKKPALLVRTKVDSLKQRGKTQEDLKSEIVEDVHARFDPNINVHFVDSVHTVGIPELIESIELQLDRAKRARWICSASALTATIIAKKRALAEKATYTYAAAAAANALNPIPGLDISLDVAVLISLERRIRDIFGITRSDLAAAEIGANSHKRLLAQSLMRFASKDAVVIFLKSVAKRLGVKQVAKWIPIVGQAVAAGLGFGLVKLAGEEITSDCERFVGAVADDVLAPPQSDAD